MLRIKQVLAYCSITEGVRYNIGAVWFFLQKRDMDHGPYVLAAKVSIGHKELSASSNTYYNAENTISTKCIPC